MKALIVIVMALVPSLFQPVPTLAHDAGARTRQTIPVNERLEDTFQLAGDSWLQLRVTPEDGGTRVEGLTDWHGVVLTERASDRTYRATNDLHFSSWTESNPPFAFDLPTGLTEQDGIFYFVEHADGDHELVVPSPPPLTRSRLRRSAMNPQHFDALRCL